MNIKDWQAAVINWFRSGKATDEHWAVMAAAMLDISETSGLDHGLDEIIAALAKEAGDGE